MPFMLTTTCNSIKVLQCPTSSRIANSSAGSTFYPDFITSQITISGLLQLGVIEVTSSYKLVEVSKSGEQLGTIFQNLAHQVSTNRL